MTHVDKRPRDRSSSFIFYSIILVTCWTVTIIVSLVWNLYIQHEETREVALNVARAYLFSDNRYRRWNARHGGVYILADQESDQSNVPPEVEESEIITPSGRKLILADHAFMMEQVYKLSGPPDNLQGELKSLNPLSKKGVADAWQKVALKSLEGGKKEVSEIVTVNDEQFIYLMRPFVIEKPCLKCHQQGGYKVGDIRGGITIRIPLAQFGLANQKQIRMLWWGHLLWWFWGILGIGICFFGVRGRVYERERAETALVKLRRQQEKILSAAGEGIYGIDSKGNISFVNPAAAKLFGAPSHELIGSSLHTTIHHTKPDGAPYPEMECPIIAALYDGQMHRGSDEWFIRKDGTSFPVDYTSAPLIEKGEIIGVVITFADVSMRKKAEEERARAQLYLQNIINAMPSILIGIDMEGRVTLWNNEAQKVTGFKPEEAYGKNLEEVSPMLFAKIADLNDVVGSQNFLKMESVYYKPQEGKGRYMDIIIYPLNLKNYRGAVIRVDDVTERVLMEERLVQSEKITSVVGLVEGMAHEINNPLGGIIQGAQNIRRRLSPELPKNLEVAVDLDVDLQKMHSYLEARQILKFIEGIRTSGKKAADIISYMLQFSQVHQVPKEPREIEKLLDSLLETITVSEEYKTKYKFDKIQFVKEYEPGLPKVPCISSEIEQVLRNVIRNAAQAIYSQDKPTAKPTIVLRLRFEGTKNMICIEVEDNGPGMDEAVQRRIFEPFYTTKPPGEGIGLGLAVSYFLITVAHQGTLDVESTPGKGAKFLIRLPIGKDINIQ